MTLIEFNNFLKENVTDEMFESLVLDCLNVRYLIVVAALIRMEIKNTRSRIRL